MYSRCTLNQNLLTNYMKDDIYNIYALMVYFWTYAHPSYCPSDLLQHPTYDSCLFLYYLRVRLG